MRFMLVAIQWEWPTFTIRVCAFGRPCCETRSLLGFGHEYSSAFTRAYCETEEHWVEILGRRHTLRRRERFHESYLAMLARFEESDNA